ncbi:MAG TPA: sugar ABC transporter permease [Stellaceae bacterium]|nr:sugar ABC transporter permease [Stellaceae bacterium]
MSSTEGILAGRHPSMPSRSGRLHGADFRWAIAFVLPYAAVFLLFVIYPVGSALLTAARPRLYAQLLSDPLYPTTVVNTALFVGFGVNLTMFLALLLSGFFLRPRWWIKALLGAFVLPWLVAAAQASVSFHWMLIGQQGLIDGLLGALFGIEGPVWFASRWLALGSDIAVYIWKWLPFWTVILIAGRLTIPREIYDQAAVDGATGWRRFVHVTVPLLSNLYLLCALLFTLWSLGEFTIPYLVSNGAPGESTEVLATLGFHYAFDLSAPALGAATVMSALPLLIPVAILLMKRLRARQVQL